MLTRRHFLLATTKTLGLATGCGGLVAAPAGGRPSRVPIVVSHGTDARPGPYLTTPRTLRDRVELASTLGFRTVRYADLRAWLDGESTLPSRSLKLDFDHPSASLHSNVRHLLAEHGAVASLFINTGVMTDPSLRDRVMTWDEIGELASEGWEIGAHTHSHPDLSEWSLSDPNGARLEDELDENDALIRRHLGFSPVWFAYTGNSWSSIAERIVERRYRIARLWMMDGWLRIDGEQRRAADFFGVQAADETDGGPPLPARYVTRRSDPYRLPALDVTSLMIRSEEGFRRFLLGSEGPVSEELA